MNTQKVPHSQATQFIRTVRTRPGRGVRVWCIWRTALRLCLRVSRFRVGLSRRRSLVRNGRDQNERCRFGGMPFSGAGLGISSTLFKRLGFSSPQQFQLRMITEC